MTEELKACPFKHEYSEIELNIYNVRHDLVRAYKKDEELYIDEHIRAVCQLCGARGPIAYNAIGAIRLWNRRPIND